MLQICQNKTSIQTSSVLVPGLFPSASHNYSQIKNKLASHSKKLLDKSARQTTVSRPSFYFFIWKGGLWITKCEAASSSETNSTCILYRTQVANKYMLLPTMLEQTPANVKETTQMMLLQHPYIYMCAGSALIHSSATEKTHLTSQSFCRLKLMSIRKNHKWYSRPVIWAAWEAETGRMESVSV